MKKNKDGKVISLNKNTTKRIKKEEIKEEEKSLKRVSIRFTKTNVYFVQIDAKSDFEAVEIGWTILNSKSKEYNSERFLIGHGFSNEILKSEDLKDDMKNSNKKSILETVKPE